MIRELVLCSIVLLLLGVVSVNAQYVHFPGVYVDPGHGGTQSGTVTHISGYNEEHVNRQVALALKDRVTHQSISLHCLSLVPHQECFAHQTHLWAGGSNFVVQLCPFAVDHLAFHRTIDK